MTNREVGTTGALTNRRDDKLYDFSIQISFDAPRFYLSPVSGVEEHTCKFAKFMR